MDYTKEQVMEILHVTRATLYRMRDDGRLHAVMPEGRQRGYRFARAEVDALALAGSGEVPAVSVRYATDQDLAQLVALSLERYGPAATVRWSVVQAWRAAFPQQFIVAIAGVTQRVLGATYVVPLRPNVLAQILEGTVPLAGLAATDLAEVPATDVLLPAFVVAEPREEPVWLLALARGLLHVVYTAWQGPTPAAQLWYPPGLPLSPFLAALAGFAPAPQGGWVASPGGSSDAVQLLRAMGQLPDAPAFDLAPTFWADRMVQGVDQLLATVIHSIVPPRTRGRRRKFAVAADRVRVDLATGPGSSAGAMNQESCSAVAGRLA